MGRSPCKIAFTLVAAVSITGCASSHWSAKSPAGPAAANAGPESTPVAGAAAADPSQAHAMQEIVAELDQAGDLDPAAREQLIADLQQTDAALWPLVVQQARALAAYRRRARGTDAAVAEGTQGPPVRPVSLQQGAPAFGADQPQRPRPAQTDRQPIRGVGRLPAADDAALAPDSAPPDAYPQTYPQTYPQMQHWPVSLSSSEPHPPDHPPAVPTDRVVGASLTSPAAEDWRRQLDGAARALESQLAEHPRTPEEVARHANLKMLYLLAGRREDALRPIPSIAPPLQEFWSRELYGLDTWLDTRRTADASRRAAEAKQILSEAANWLGESAPLVVRNLSFCTNVQSFGCVEQFESYEFSPQQEVLLYAEVDNFSSESTPKGHHTSLRSSYQIIDAGGRRVADENFTNTEEHCHNPRRDFFIAYHLRLPKRIYPGRYTLQLTIEDLKSHKIGQASIELTVKDQD